MATRRARQATNLHHLRIFHTLATTGSFTGAARRLGISQPAVTNDQDRAQAAVVRAFLTLARSRRRGGPPPS
jgi:molybdenum-dependent DNA-binding transcriptional regulator ModE